MMTKRLLRVQWFADAMSCSILVLVIIDIINKRQGYCHLRLLIGAGSIDMTYKVVAFCYSRLIGKIQSHCITWYQIMWFPFFS